MLQDFGEVTLKGSSIFVKLAQDFAPLIKRSNYQVFLTANGPVAVYVRKRTRNGFEIARLKSERDANANGVQIGYSIVARRSDLSPSRLPKVKLPAMLVKLTRSKIQKMATLPAALKKQSTGALTRYRYPRSHTELETIRGVTRKASTKPRRRAVK